MLAAGQNISPNVRLSRMLGEGGMGAVWAADHLTLRTEVAVKFIAAELATNEEALHRFTREATSAARIKNPHVVQVFDHGIYEGRPYIVMELLSGEDLSDRLDRSGALPVPEVAQILHQACKALGAAHQLGIVHRDIKPANIFLTWSADDLFVKLLDFGIAKQVGAGQPAFTTASNTIVGTPFYMSPEQVFAHETVDFRSDLWSLAVVAYQMITGALPFTGETLANLYVALHQGTFRAPSTFPQVPFPALDPWFSRALSREPTARFASARELSQTFAAIARECGRQYVPEPPEQSDARTIRRPDGLAGLLKEAEEAGIAAAASQAFAASDASDATETPAMAARPSIPSLPDAHETPGPASSPSTPPYARPAPRLPVRTGMLTIGVAAGVLAVGLGAIFLVHSGTGAPPTAQAVSTSATASALDDAPPRTEAPPLPGTAPEPTVKSSAEGPGAAPPVVVPSVEAGPALTAMPSATASSHAAPVKSAGPTLKPAPVPGPESTSRRRDHGF